jgi:hypothetical protein
MLIIEWEPRDVYLACALEDTRGHVQTTAVMSHHNICVIRAIESLIRTVLYIKYTSFLLLLLLLFDSRFFFLRLFLDFNYD